MVVGLVSLAASRIPRISMRRDHMLFHLELVLLDDSITHVVGDLPQHSDHCNVGFTRTSRSTYQEVLIAAGQERVMTT